MNANQLNTLTVAAEEMVNNNAYLLRLVEQLPADLQPEYLAKVRGMVGETGEVVKELRENQIQNICN